MIIIRRAVYEDIPDIMQFMDEHWKPGNILAKNRDFFEWQFVNGDKLNMFVGVDDESGKIYGIRGAILYNGTENPDISGCTWQAIKSSRPMLGPELYDYMHSHLNRRYNCIFGLTDKSARLHKLLGRTVLELDHYYRLADWPDYKIARVAEKVIPVVEETGYTLDHIDTVGEMKSVISEEMLAAQIPYKDYGYIDHRYFRHPIYRYDFWKILDEAGVPHSVLVTRDETLQDRRICKMIDFYGRIEDLGKIAGALDRLMEENEYEFVDIYSYGIPTELYEQGGLLRCDKNSENIIPNYFHPFVRENISLRILEPTVAGVRIFRGDGDQDRPC